MAIRVISNRYTTIESMKYAQGNTDLADIADPTGQSTIDDEFVQQVLLDVLYKSSREVDAYLLKHMTIPIAEDIDAITVGTLITFTYDSKDVVGVGCAFDTELEENDEIYADNEPYWFGVVDRIIDANNLVLKYDYNGVTIADTAAYKRTINVPGWIEIAALNFSMFNLWKRRGRLNEDNPWWDDKEQSRNNLIDFQNSRQKFVDGSTVRKNNWVKGERLIEDRKFTSTKLRRFTNPYYGDT